MGRRAAELAGGCVLIACATALGAAFLAGVTWRMLLRRRLSGQ